MDVGNSAAWSATACYVGLEPPLPPVVPLCFLCCSIKLHLNFHLQNGHPAPRRTRLCPKKETHLASSAAARRPCSTGRSTIWHLGLEFGTRTQISGFYVIMRLLRIPALFLVLNNKGAPRPPLLL